LLAHVTDTSHFDVDCSQPSIRVTNGRLATTFQIGSRFTTYVPQATRTAVKADNWNGRWRYRVWLYGPAPRVITCNDCGLHSLSFTTGAPSVLRIKHDVLTYPHHPDDLVHGQ